MEERLSTGSLDVYLERTDSEREVEESEREFEASGRNWNRDWKSIERAFIRGDQCGQEGGRDARSSQNTARAHLYNTRIYPGRYQDINVRN